MSGVFWDDDNDGSHETYTLVSTVYKFCALKRVAMESGDCFLYTENGRWKGRALQRSGAATTACSYICFI